ncbi:Imm50 family immunity protein [Streptomyces sp. NBC_01803]|uniref:Imm50 family immunity protein n=1 Tax=Streptomyces sp. NBC_01803 TaxID=2975946 RepID=UPI002DD86475|nr:Imm50 family immunity protein [Streptomyces sp. NBC_01803]WSA43081.1 immunity 50 family protein [Streptomyces sp. NBC_01803]
MTPHWADLLTDRERIARYYSEVPPLDGAVLRSVRLDRDGPTLLLRLDLPVFPDRPEEEWTVAGCDRFQCQIRFLAVEDIRVAGWPFLGGVDLGIQPLEPAEERRVAVVARARADGADVVRFSCNASLSVGHLAAYRDGDGGPYLHAGRVDRIRFGTRLPNPTDKAYYERL